MIERPRSKYSRGQGLGDSQEWDRNVVVAISRPGFGTESREFSYTKLRVSSATLDFTRVTRRKTRS
jgi:hypothetical protein